MKKLQNIIRNWAIADGNPEPEFIEYEEGVRSSYGFHSPNKHANYRMLIYCNEKTEIFTAYAYSPFEVPEDRREEVGELFVRLNRQILMGNFDLDFSDGEVRFRAGMDVEGGELTQQMIDNLIGACVWCWEKHYQMIMDVAFGDTPAYVAVQEDGRYMRETVLQ